MSSRSFRSLVMFIVLPVGVAGLVVALAFYLSSSGLTLSRTHAGAPGSEIGSAQETYGAAKFACPVSLQSNSSTEERREVEHRAQRMMDAKKFDEALASYRELAGMDPAFPGVNLDISMALSKLKQPAASKQAIDSQLALSMCLAQLFPNELEPYCRAEGFASTADCMKELGSIQQGSYIQAALVQMDIDHKVKPVPVAQPRAELASAAMLPLGEPRVKKPAAEGGATRVKRAPELSKDALASGSGTDAALGAYSK